MKKIMLTLALVVAASQAFIVAENDKNTELTESTNTIAEDINAIANDLDAIEKAKKALAEAQAALEADAAKFEADVIAQNETGEEVPA